MTDKQHGEVLLIEAKPKSRRDRIARREGGRPTGPRTKRGKARSRYNALKHGIFGRVVLRGSALKESKADYLNLLASLRESFQPEGGVEELLVEKLAMLAWRKARAVRAEAALITKQTEFLREDREARLKDTSQGHNLELAILAGGITRHPRNPYLLAKAIRLLEALEDAIQYRGFNPEEDEGVLKALYGERGHRDGLFLSYRIHCDRPKEASDEAARSKDQQAFRSKDKQAFLKLLETEIRQLQAAIVDLEARGEKELSLKEESMAIPGEEKLDRLLRYEARLDGAFDRTLQQLERLQRMRQGQPVPPTLKVDVTRV